MPTVAYFSVSGSLADDSNYDAKGTSVTNVLEETVKKPTTAESSLQSAVAFIDDVTLRKLPNDVLFLYHHDRCPSLKVGLYSCMGVHTTHSNIIRGNRIQAHVVIL